MTSDFRRSKDKKLEGAAQAIDLFLSSLGLDIKGQPELQGTGHRVAQLFLSELCAGYTISAFDLLNKSKLSLQNSAQKAENNEKKVTSSASWVQISGVPILTTCPHHLMPATGTAEIIFAPKTHLVGIGAVHEALHALSRRLTLQEVIGEEFVGHFEKALLPRWVLCHIKMQHTCIFASGHGQAVKQISTLATRGKVPAKVYAMVSKS